jgi:large repetitive protein
MNIFFCLLLVLLATSCPAASPALATGAVPVKPALTNVSGTKGATAAVDRGFTYLHDDVPRVPWSIHVVKAARNRMDLELDTALGGGTTLGMGIVSEIMALVPPGGGKPVAAINGDFFNYSKNFPGDPEGLQIARGELVSAPNPQRACVWMDAQRELHRAEVAPHFQVTWPNGTKTPLGLNEEREIDAVVLYTAAVGASTHTYKGRELVLVPQTNSAWLPLEIGKSYVARVKAIHDAGNTPLTRDTMVLSIGPRVLACAARITNGSVVQISTATTPDLAGAKTGIGGGPTLVRGGKPGQWRSFIQVRHPRSAIGWNKDYFFMVEVDGRQTSSIGMTFAELADYLVKLGCQEAINLDGGGSTTLWVEGNVMNSPSQGQERPCANAVVLRQKPAK